MPLTPGRVRFGHVEVTSPAGISRATDLVVGLLRGYECALTCDDLVRSVPAAGLVSRGVTARDLVAQSVDKAVERPWSRRRAPAEASGRADETWQVSRT